MKEFRVLLLVFYTVVASRLIGETTSRFGSLWDSCGLDAAIIVVFILSTYFCDSCYEQLRISRKFVERIANLTPAIPYILAVSFVSYKFISTTTAVAIEHIVTTKALYLALVYFLTYKANNITQIRKMNTLIMLSFLISLTVFSLVSK